MVLTSYGSSIVISSWRCITMEAIAGADIDIPGGGWSWMDSMTFAALYNRTEDIQTKYEY